MSSEKKKITAGKVAEGAANGVFGVAGAVLRVIITVLLIVVTTVLLVACIFAFYAKTCLTDDLDVSLGDFKLAESSVILYEDADGQWQELTTLYSSENRTWVEYKDIPEDFEHALVAIEDKRFYTHKGVDWYRTAGAFVNMFLGMRSDFGGSTITQQLIKNLTGFDEATVQRKLLEIFRALDFEKRYDKKQIIEWYLNAVYFGEGCYGIEAAAQKYYGKSVGECSLAETASIISITNNPSKYSPFASMTNNKSRQEDVLRCMYEQKYISYDEYMQAVNEQLVPVRSENEAYVQVTYTYYEETVINDVLEDFMEQKGVSRKTAADMLYNGGYRIYCCLDARIQQCVDSVYENVDALPKPYTSSNQQMQSSMVIMDPYTGEIVAMAGGVGEKTINFGLNRATDSQRPPGSSFKPLAVYGPALEYGLISQTTLVNDAGPDVIQLSKTSWYPRNAGGGYSGIITIRTALQKSLNTVSAQILDKLGVSASYDYLSQKLGITSLVDADRDYAPLALGQLTNGITVREMATAYCSFVNDGVFTNSRTYTKVTDGKGAVVLENSPVTHVAWTANTAYNMLDMLENAVNYGTGRAAWLGTMPVAGKTGTTSSDWDRWFAGMTPYYVGVVWTGYDTPEPLNISTNPACVIWKEVMSAVHEGLEYREFPDPVIGEDTMLFGDLKRALEEQNNPSPSPSPSEEPEESPAVTEAPEPTPAEPVEPVEPAPGDEGTPTDPGGFEG